MKENQLYKSALWGSHAVPQHTCAHNHIQTSCIVLMTIMLFPWKEIQEYIQLNLYNINWYFFSFTALSGDLCKFWFCLLFFPLLGIEPRVLYKLGRYSILQLSSQPHCYSLKGFHYVAQAGLNFTLLLRHALTFHPLPSASWVAGITGLHPGQSCLLLNHPCIYSWDKTFLVKNQ